MFSLLMNVWIVDIEKAYDHVNWDFLLYLLRKKMVLLDSTLYFFGVLFSLGE
jgi:hypothetical protein